MTAPDRRPVVVAIAARALAPLMSGGTPLVITHGNGPQVGALAEGAERAGRHVPLSVLVAESQGHIGHLLQVALEAVAGDRRVCCVLAHVEVDARRATAAPPTKPIGAVVDEARARRLARRTGGRCDRTVPGGGERCRRPTRCA